MTEKTIQHQDFFENIQKKIIEESTAETNASIAETFDKQGYTTEGMMDLIDKGYGKHIANNIHVFVNYCRGWDGGIDGTTILHRLIYNGFGEQVTHHMNCLDDIMVPLDQRKELFKSLIASEQGNFLLENVKLYPSEHQSVVDILLATESEWGDYEKDELWQEHYDAGQTPLIIEYLDKLTSIDQAKTLQYLIKKDQFEALEKYLHLKGVDRIECITSIYPRLIESRYWNIVEKILTEDERKKIGYAILEDNKNNQAMAAYMFTHRHRFCLTLDEIENLSR